MTIPNYLWLNPIENKLSIKIYTSDKISITKMTGYPLPKEKLDKTNKIW